MEGSDPVCLRAITETLEAGHHELEAHWRRVRAGLDQCGRGVASSCDFCTIEGRLLKG